MNIQSQFRPELPTLGWLISVMGIMLLGRTLIAAAEVTGKVSSSEEGAPLAGAKVKLALRKDSTYTQADGTFRLIVGAISIKGDPADNGMAAPLLKGGELLFWTPSPIKEVRLEAFSLKGARISDRIHRLSGAGEQRLELRDALQGLQGIGWLRLAVQNDIHCIRIVNVGAADIHSGEWRAGSRSAQKQTAASAIVDTILIEKPGYYTAKDYLYSIEEKNRNFQLWKNSIYGLASSEVEAWKTHLLKPVQLIMLSRTSVTLPLDRTGGAIVSADGKEVDRWQTDFCRPDAPPRSLHLAYEKDGRSYQDTVSLESYWRLMKTFRNRKDSLTEYRARYSLSWDWPKGMPDVAERDWMEVVIGNGMTEDYLKSYPDVFQEGIRFGIEGGMTRYGIFDPRDGSLVATAFSGGWAMYKAQFTLARRPGHDLRIQIDANFLPADSVTFEFGNSWPADGRLRMGQEVRLQGISSPPVPAATLEFGIPSLLDSWWPIDSNWDGTVRNWIFPYPVREATAFKIRMRENAQKTCPGLAESPLLLALPDPADTAVTAFEPNETLEQAALIPRGAWISAAWDLKSAPDGMIDVDYYRFRANQGEKIHVWIRNPNPEEIHLHQEFSRENSGFSVDRAGEGTYTYGISETGDCLFTIRTLDPLGGRYSFRIDTVE